MQKHSVIAAIVMFVFVAGAAAVVIAPGRNDISHGETVGSIGPEGKRAHAVAPGRIEPPSGVIKVAAPSVGIVSNILVKVNDTVFAGEPLILLNDDEIQARYMAAEAQVGMRKRLRDEQSATGKAAERRRAEDAVFEAETALFEAQIAVDKAAMAWRTSGGPATSVTQVRAALARAQEEIVKRQAHLRTVQADAPLPNPLDAQVASARGELALARVNLEKLKIRAPIDGTVLQINIRQGELAAPNALQPLLLIANLTALNVRAEVDERDVGEIKVGQPARVRVSAFPGREFAGTVQSIAPLVEASRIGPRAQGNRADVDAVEVVVRLAQPGPLTTGMKVDVYFNQDMPK